MHKWWLNHELTTIYAIFLLNWNFQLCGARIGEADSWSGAILSRRFFRDFSVALSHSKQHFQQSIVLLRQHKAKPDIFIAQEGEGGAIPYHEVLADGCIKHITRSKILI